MRGEARLEAARGPHPAADRGLRAVHVDHGRPQARRGARDPRAELPDPRRARGGDEAGRLPRVHDLDRVARLPRREGPEALPRGDGPGLHALQDEGEPRPRGQPAPRRAHARGDRPGAAAQHGREPVLGRGRGHRAGEGPRALRPVVDRGAHEPRRRARPRHDREGHRPDQGRDRRDVPEPGDVQAAAAGGCPRLLPDRRLPGGRRERGARDPAARREVRGAGLPARGRRRPLRVRAAPGHLRLHRREPLDRGPPLRVRRPPPRALRRSGAHA